MCENKFSLIVYYGYIGISIFIPVFYLISYKLHKSKKKHWGKAIFIAVLMLCLLFSVKGIAYLLGDDNINCYLNNVCSCKNDDNEENRTTITTTTTTKRVVEQKYQRIEEPTGVKKVIGKSSKGYDIYTIDGITYVDGFLIVNKTYELPSDYVPKNTKNTTTTPEFACQDCINVKAYEAFQVMKADAQAAGIKLWIQSGYRSYILQNTLYNRYISREQQKGLSYDKAASEADTYSARPGHSEHQTGECFDLNDAGRAFNGTAAAKWVNQNASKYGFIIRYPEGKTNETGYIYESWHLRYVGEDLASKLYNNGDWITMETYFGLTSTYKE